MKLSTYWLAIPLILVTAPALSQPVLEDLEYSYPKAGYVEREPIRFVQLHFDADVDLSSVEIGYPDDTKAEIYNAFTDLIPMKKNKVFAITLPKPLEQSGRYNVFYAISMTRANNTTDTNVGSFEFTIELPATKASDVDVDTETDSATPQ